MEKTLIVMAAGMGSRFGGLKQLNKFTSAGKTLLDFAIEDAKAAGFTEVAFVIRRDIEGEFKRQVGARHEKSISVKYAFQSINDLPSPYKAPGGRTKPWGTGQAVLACKDIVKNPFLVINADDYYGKSVYKIMGDFLEAMTPKTYALAGYRLGNTLSKNGGVSRGICNVSSDGFLIDVKEHANLREISETSVADSAGEVFPKSALVSMNFWAFGSDIFDILSADFESFLRENSESLKSEFYLPFAVDKAVKNGLVSVKVLPNSEIWQGVTYKEDVGEVERFLVENR